MVTRYELTLRKYYTDFNTDVRGGRGGSTDYSMDDYCELTKEEYETITSYLIKNRQGNKQEIAHGRWIPKYREILKYYETWKYNCSNCGGGTDVNYNYCPHCGAKMDGEGGEQ